MKKVPLLILFAVIFLLLSCSGDETKTDAPKTITAHAASSDTTFTTDWKALTNDYMKWYNYSYYNIRLSQEFIALDTDSVKIDKEAFINKVIAENVIALKTKILNGQPVYQLFKLNSNDKKIKNTSTQMAAAELVNYKMEGREIPVFSFTDINGETYSKASVKGKILVLKCWFIHCVACVKEFPELNKLVDEYEDKKDVLFVSLALDSKKELVQFFKTKAFKYATVPDMNNYMSNKLNVAAYPTHLLIGRDGKIIKVVQQIEDLEPFLKEEISKSYASR